MQLLYGNDGTNYSTIARSAELTERQAKEIIDGYVAYDFIRDESVYSNVSKEPVSLTLVTTDLAHTFPEEKILLVRSARMSNYLTPSFYSHVFLLDFNESILTDGFGNLLRSTFIRDSEILEYGNDTIDNFRLEADERISLNDKALDAGTLCLLVAGLLQVADSLSGELKVILDVDGDGYNQRVLDVIASVYSCIPFNIRKTAGFSTYSGSERMLSSRIKFQIYSRESAGRISGNVFDLRYIQAEQMLSALPERLVRMAEVFVSKEAVRDTWFKRFQKVFGVGNVSVQEHLDLFENVQSWMEQDLESGRDKWAKYAWQEQLKQEKSPVFKEFCEIVNERFEREGFKTRYIEILQEDIARQDSYEVEKRLKAYMMLGEVMPVLEIPEKMFVDWQEDKIVGPLEKQYEDQELLQKLRLQYQTLQNNRFGSEKCARVFDALKMALKAKCEKVEAEIRQRTADEKSSIKDSLKEIILKNQQDDALMQLYQEIKYEKNKEQFTQMLGKGLIGYLKQLPYFKSFSNYTSYVEFVRRCKCWIPEEYVKLIEGLLETKGELVEKMENDKKVCWESREDILGTYENIVEMRKTASGREVKVPDFELSVAGEKFNFKEEELISLILFLCAPTEENQSAFLKLSSSRESLKEQLLQAEMFGEEHFTTLQKLADQEPSFGKEMIKYYAGQGVLLSKEGAGKGIADFSQQDLEDALINCDEINILTMLIGQELEKSKNNNSENYRSKSSERKGLVLGGIVFMILLPVLMSLLLLGNKFLNLEITAFWKNMIAFILAGAAVVSLCISLFWQRRNHILTGLGTGFVLALLIWQYNVLL